MRNFTLLIAFFGLFTFVRCADDNKSTSSVEPLSIVNNEALKKGSPVTISHVELNKDTLEIDVTYSGGCEDHSFELLFNGQFAKSLPVQAHLVLYHNANKDQCKKLITEKLKFDVSALKENYSQVLIELAGNKEKIIY